MKSKISCFFLNEKQNFNKNKTEQKMETPAHAFRGMNLALYSSYKNRELKMKLWWIEARGRKKSSFFLTLIFLRGHFFSDSGNVTNNAFFPKLSITAVFNEKNIAQNNSVKS